MAVELQKKNILKHLGIALPLPMCGSMGTGLPVVQDSANPSFAADLIHFDPGRGTPLHTHPGSHILVVFAGEGELFFAGEEHLLLAGDVYLVPGGSPHAIRALDTSPGGMTLLSIACDHRPVDSSARLEVISV